jgi:translation initiation factor 4E
MAAEGAADVPLPEEVDSGEYEKGAEVAGTDKHFLQHTWTLWYDSPSAKKPDPSNWHTNVKKVVSFSSVEDFWSLFNNIMQPSNLTVGCNYHLFKDGIMPAWEDPQNENGGKWMVEFAPREKDVVNKSWLLMVLAMIGEAFEHGSDICGLVIGMRRTKVRLSLWTKTAADVKAQTSIGQNFKKIIQWRNAKLTYQAHLASNGTILSL